MQSIRFVSVQDLNNDIINNIHRIPKDVDLIVGVPRSGMLVATLLALYLNKPLADIDSYLNQIFFSYGRTKDSDRFVPDFASITKVLVVEDSSNSGYSIIQARKKIEQSNILKDYVWVAAYVTDKSSELVDIYFRNIPYPRIFEWNFMHHPLLEKACVDIDGVLCMDPTNEQNDDGVEYQNFILNAKMRYMPTAKIGWLVTSRLEKYRAQTEEWLRENNIKYNHLIMLDMDSAQERQQSACHAQYKAEVFKGLREAEWFVESEKQQAEIIARISKKSVYCVDAQYFYSISDEAFVVLYFKRTIKKLAKKVLRMLLPNKVVEKIRRY